MMSLEELLTHVLSSGELTPKSLAPMRAAVKRYAEALGAEAKSLQPTQYDLPPTQVRVLIEAKAPEEMATKTIANRWQMVCRLLSIGRTHGWLMAETSGHTEHSWLHRRRLLPYGHFPARTDGHVNRSRYRLHPLPPAVLQDLDAYLGWCQGTFTPGRRLAPRSIHKRAITTDNARAAVASIAGFAVNHGLLSVDTMTLIQLCDPALCEAFASWWQQERQGKVTRGLIGYLIQLQVIAKYWVQDQDIAQELHRLIHADLPHPAAVWSKEEVLREVSLAKLREVAESSYPLNATRMQESRYTREVARHLAEPTRYRLPHGSARRMAWQAEVSLLLYCLVEYPWRQRQYRDLCLEQQLRRQPDGTFLMRFSGKELKIGRRSDGTVNELRGVLDGPLAERMEEWLTLWRPFLTTDPQERHVFLNLKGQPLDAWNLCYWIKAATYRFLGVRVHPHVIRDIWASEYLDATGDVAGAAKRLGNTMQTIHHTYGHVLEAKAQARTSAWLHGHLSQPSPVPQTAHTPADPHPLNRWREQARVKPEVETRQMALL